MVGYFLNTRFNLSDPHFCLVFTPYISSSLFNFTYRIWKKHTTLLFRNHPKTVTLHDFILNFDLFSLLLFGFQVKQSGGLNENRRKRSSCISYFPLQYKWKISYFFILKWKIGCSYILIRQPNINNFVILRILWYLTEPFVCPLPSIVEIRFL